MTRLFHVDAQQIVVRQPDGSILVDTNSAPPTLDGTASFTGVEIVFTEVGKPVSIFYSSPQWYKSYGGGQYQEADVVLGPSGVTSRPDMVWGRYNLTQTHGTRWKATGGVAGIWDRLISNGEWTPFTGGVQLEQDVASSELDGEATWAIRYFNIEWINGDFVLKPRWSVYAGGSNGFNSAASIPNSYSRFIGTIELAWGSFYGGEI